MKFGGIHPKLADELRKARMQFSRAAAKDEPSALLTLVDPIRAFADAGVKLLASPMGFEPMLPT